MSDLVLRYLLRSPACQQSDQRIYGAYYQKIKNEIHKGITDRMRPAVNFDKNINSINNGNN